MSRSSWAWARTWELVGAAVSSAGRLGKLEVRESLEAAPPVRKRSSLAALTWVATAVMLMWAMSPALALGKSASRSGRAPAGRALQAASRTPATRTEPSSDPAHSSGSHTRRPAARAQVLAIGSGYTSAHGAGAVRTLQRRLAQLGYAPGPIDGRYGPLTERAVVRFQATHGLVADGIVGPLTRAALASARLVLRPGDGNVPGGSALVKTLQRHLAAAGFPPGPIDGRYGPVTERAVTRFQAARHLHVDGIAGPQTLGHLQRAAQRTSHARPRPRTAPHPRTAPRPKNHRAPSPRTPTPSTTPAPAPAPSTPAHSAGHPTRHPAGTSLVPWLVVAACLVLAMLGALLLYRHRDRATGSQVVAAAPDGHREDVATHAPAGVAGHELTDPGADADHAQEVQPTHPPQPLHPPDGASAFKLARLLAEAGNVAGAADAFRRAEERGHPSAAFELGVLLLNAGDVEGAEDAFSRADQRGDPNAACNLGVLLEQRGDLADAKLAYQRADERGHAVGAWNLASLLAQRGDTAGAKQAFERAEQRGEPMAAFDLGRLLEREGDPDGARLAYQRADEHGHAGAAFNLGVLLVNRGDVAGAEDAFSRADQRGDPDAACNLGLLLEQRGDIGGATRAYQRADERGHAVGAWNLGCLLEQRGDRAGAKAAYERADQRGYAAGACNLGQLLEEEGDRAGAVEAFTRASEAGPPEVAELAYAALRDLRSDESHKR